MRHDNLICIVCLCISMFMACSCSHNTYADLQARRKVQSDSLSELSAKSVQDAATRITTDEKINEGFWRLRLKFDTEQPVDSKTNLPPLKEATIEGKQKETTKEADYKTTGYKETTINSSTSQLTNRDESIRESSQKETKVLTRIEDSIGWSLIISVIAILCFIYIRYVRKKNSSK